MANCRWVSPAPPAREAGFNLVEMIVVIAITGILSSIVAVFIKGPVSGYIDTTRRAGLTDIADTALRRISRDLHLALPNSVRVSPDGSMLEFLQTSTGGRYRVDAPGDILDFTDDADNSFDVLGPAITLTQGDEIVIYNLGIPGADAYAGGNRRKYPGGGMTGNNVAYTPVAGNPFPFDSPGHHFFVISGPISYVCNAGTLTRFWGYAITNAQPAAFGAGTPSALLATRVSNCQFAYTPGMTDRSGLVEMRLQLTRDGETITLYQAAQVNNVP